MTDDLIERLHRMPGLEELPQGWREMIGALEGEIVALQDVVYMAEKRGDILLGEENLQARWTLEAKQQCELLKAENEKLKEAMRAAYGWIDNEICAETDQAGAHMEPCRHCEGIHRIKEKILEALGEEK